ncbi:MAG: hypothetical protein MUE46_15755 [Xanthomonadales bacterium]|jgi:hypothetical protein|nr:hypothetical protein [Xanthomonadales bacterium]
MTPQNKGRAVLVGLFLMFMTPICIALALQTPLMHWDPAETRNHGELLQPPVSVRELVDALKEPDGQPKREGVWTMLFLPDGHCGPACDEALDLLRRVRETQGRKMNEVRVLMLLDHEDPWKVETSNPALRVLQAPSTEAIAAVRQQLGLGDAEAGLFMVDPGGLAMMRYRAPIDGTAVRKDLGVLLRVVEAAQPE